MKDIKVQKDGIIKTIPENLLPTYLEMGWKEVVDIFTTFNNPFAKIK